MSSNDTRATSNDGKAMGSSSPTTGEAGVSAPLSMATVPISTTTTSTSATATPTTESTLKSTTPLESPEGRPESEFENGNDESNRNPGGTYHDDGHDGNDNNDPHTKKSRKQDLETATDATTDSVEDKPENSTTTTTTTTVVVSSSKKSRLPPFVYDPNKITLRFLFANRDGLTVTVECNPTDTVGEVKGALISCWPEGVPPCEGDELRLVCMGKGFLMPDSRTLQDCQVPVFKTHATPINVSIKPKGDSQGETKNKKVVETHSGTNSPRNTSLPTSTVAQSSPGCPCTIL